MILDLVNTCSFPEVLATDFGSSLLLVILSSAIPILFFFYCFILCIENALKKHILAISIFITLYDEMWLKCKCGNAHWLLRYYVVQFGRNLPVY